MNTLGFIGNLGPWEWIIILVLGLLIFGKRLPEVGKSLGKGIVEFKKGLKGVEDEVDQASSRRGSLPENERHYHSPITDGQERRVSREDVVDQPATPRQPMA
ncbi:MAG: twin-arginine translocase TatA/TatE family subunit [Phycisphaerales bacterium]|jgi:sec-independent protein translocase protein TatA